MLSRRTGYQVSGAQLSAGWEEQYGAYASAHMAKGRWRDVLAPAIADRRVVATKRGARTFFRPADLGLAVPPDPVARGRRFSPALVRLSDQGEAVVRRLAERTGFAVLSPDVETAWPDVHRKPVPARYRGRIPRLLLPSTRNGTLRRTVVRGVSVFRPAEAPDLPDPPYFIEEDRVAEAVRRAAERVGSAVPLKEVEVEIDRDPLLRLDGTASLGVVLSRLARRGKVRGLRAHRRGVRSRQYYAPTDGPPSIRAVARTTLDRRLDLIRGYWEATGGLPFSTRRIRRFARRSDPERFAREPVWAWTVALHHLARVGFLVKFRRARRRYALWAPADVWSRLPESDRRERLKDVLRQPAGLPLEPSQQLARHLRYDPGGISRNHDMRALFQLARTRKVDRSRDPAEAALAQRRPLMAAEVEALVDESHPLLPVVPLAVAMEEAARLRPQMVRSELVLVAGSDNRAWYDLERTPDADAFGAYLRALDELDLGRLRRSVDRLQEGLTAMGGPIEVAEAALAAQWQQIKHVIDRHVGRFERAVEAAPLEPLELEEARDILRSLDLLLGRLSGLRALLPVATGAPGPVEDREVPGYSLDAAWRELEPVTGYALDNPRGISARLPLVPVLPKPEMYPVRDGPGRQRVQAFDRIAYALYACSRWGGRRLRYLAGVAASSIGEGRSAAPFLETLSAGRPETHPGAIAALAIFDDPDARDALTAHLERWLAGTGPASSATAAEFATWGLAPLPFAPGADALDGPEAAVLERLQTHASDERVRSAAGAVLGFWGGTADALSVLDYFGPRPLDAERWPPAPAGEWSSGR